MENYVICNCMKVTYADVENALYNSNTFEDVQKAFEHVQQATHCSTGCGGCHDQIMDVISQIMHQQA